MEKKRSIQDSMKRMFTGARFKQPRDIEEYRALFKNHMLCIYKMGATLPICGMPKCNKTARYDTQLPQGPWGYICHEHTKVLNTAVGLGRGQALITVAEHANLGGKLKEEKKLFTENLRSEGNEKYEQRTDHPKDLIIP
jgi:hypothetical protein